MQDTSLMCGRYSHAVSVADLASLNESTAALKSEVDALVLIAVASLALGYLGISLVRMPDVSVRGADLAQVPVSSLVGSERHLGGAAITIAAAVCALLAAVLLMRAASGAHPTGKYAAPAARRSAARTGSGTGEVSERGMWDALDEGRDPTETVGDPEGR